MKNIFIKIKNYWYTRNTIEKKLLLVSAGLVISIGIWLLWLQPVLIRRAQLSEQLPELRNQLVQATLLAHKISINAEDLKNTPVISQEALTKNLEIAGLNFQNLEFHGDAITIKLTNVSFSVLINWLHDAQITFHFLVDDVDITVLEQSDQVNARLVLRKII